jgi:hypothetical protein
MPKGLKKKYGRDERKMMASAEMDEDRKVGKKKGRRKRGSKR